MENSLSRQVIDQYQKFADVVYRGTLVACKLLCVVMVFSVFYAVLGRFVLPRSPRWCEELGILCMVWICFLSATMAIRDGIHIRMTVFEYVLSVRVVKALHILSYVMLLALSVVWIFAGWQVIQLTLIPKMPSTRLPMAVQFGAVFASGVLGAIMSLSRLLKGGW